MLTNSELVRTMAGLHRRTARNHLWSKSVEIIITSWCTTNWKLSRAITNLCIYIEELLTEIDYSIIRIRLAFDREPPRDSPRLVPIMTHASYMCE